MGLGRRRTSKTRFTKMRRAQLNSCSPPLSLPFGHSFLAPLLLFYHGDDPRPFQRASMIIGMKRNFCIPALRAKFLTYDV